MKAEYQGESELAEYIQRGLEGKSFDIEEPTGYGSPNKPLGKLYITDVIFDYTPYTPAISILTEPRTFMAFVPADKALQVAKDIKEKYDCEMSKVRNRLPLTFGIVFAGRRTPLPAILDAGRRMLKQSSKNELWEVTNVASPCPGCNSWPSEINLTLHREKQTLPVTVSTVMGDGKTEDVWYPYWHLEKGEKMQIREKGYSKASMASIGPMSAISRLEILFLSCPSL